MVILSLAVIAAYGCTALQGYVQSWRGRRWALAAGMALTAFMLLEFAVVDLPTVTIPVGGDVPRVYEDLAGIEGAVMVEVPMPSVADGLVLEDPLNVNFGTVENLFQSADREQTAAYFSIYHWKKTVNGMSGYYPLFYRRALVEMAAFPGPRALAFLRAAGVDHIVARWDDFPAERVPAVRETLEEEPGVELLRDYGDGFSLYRLSGADTVAAARLDLPVFLPESTSPGALLHASVGFLNPAAAPFVNLSELRQHLRAEWRDGSGAVVREEDTYFYAPFFVAGGGGACAHFQLRAPADSASYTLTLTATDGVLAGRVWEESIAVGDASSGGGAGEGVLAREPRGEGGALSLYPGEVLSLDVTASNGGEAQWVRETADMLGSVCVSAVWRREDAPGYELRQRGMLPCDLSPGQALTFPVALQAPRDPGDYVLTLRLEVLGGRFLGEPVNVPAGVRYGSPVATPSM